MEYKPLYTVKEAAKLLCTGTGMVYKLIKSGDLPAIKLGELKIRGKELEQFIDNCPTVTNGDL
jgi:excisionase family DNA binding protein